jgi:WS/DGAT/MGAT family acyltransferase
MTSADAAWLHMDRPTNLMVINAVMWFDAPLDWKAYKQRLLERLVEPFPRFRQRPFEGFPGTMPSWEDVDYFDLELHCHRLALPAPGDRDTLQEVLSDLVSQPLDRTRPMWDIYCFENYGEGSALLARVHHAIADGIALGQAMLSLTDEDADPDAFADPRARGRRGPLAPVEALARPLTGAVAAGASLTQLALRQTITTVRQPGRLARLARAAGDDAAAAGKLLLTMPDPQGAFKTRPQVAHRVAWSDPLPLAEVKAAGKALGATINDVLGGAVAGALRRQQEARGEEPAAVHALVPYNLRPQGKPMSRGLGNRFGLILLELPVDEPDPLARVRTVADRMTAIKKTNEGVISFTILTAMGRTAAAVEERLIDFFTAKGTMVLTNVPGPRETLSVCGTPMAGVLVWAPASGSLNMSISIFSYAGLVSVGFLADRGLGANPHELGEAFRDEVHGIQAAAGAAA